MKNQENNENQMTINDEKQINAQKHKKLVQWYFIMIKYDDEELIFCDKHGSCMDQTKNSGRAAFGHLVVVIS